MIYFLSSSSSSFHCIKYFTRNRSWQLLTDILSLLSRNVRISWSSCQTWSLIRGVVTFCLKFQDETNFVKILFDKICIDKLKYTRNIIPLVWTSQNSSRGREVEVNIPISQFTKQIWISYGELCKLKSLFILDLMIQFSLEEN